MSSTLNDHFHTFLEETNNKRNYYDELFSSDSEDETLCDGIDTSYDFQSNDKKESRCFISNIREVLKRLDLETDIDGHTKYLNDDNSESTSSLFDEDTTKSDMSISTGESMEISSIINEQSVHTPFNDDSSMDSLLSINSDQCTQLLKDDSVETVNTCNSRLQDRLRKEEEATSVKLEDDSHEDIIGSFNIQNKFDHSIAAKLFVDGKFSFLSLQEPRASHNTTQDSWKNCQRAELDSAAITCHETHHQIILYDSWKWGGKVISEFGSELNGRIAHIGFNFAGEQLLGIISVYALARGGEGSDKDRKEELRHTTVLLIRRQIRKWKKKFPSMQVMILGDMQETESITDLDNLGSSRFSNTCDNGILRALEDTHTSIVRDRHDGERYLTRFGREGARGIDHILFPNSPKAQAMIQEASIDNNFASLYFPSDHKLIKCTYIRHGENNVEESDPVVKYAFGTVSQIKMKREVHNGVHQLSFDDSQFKGSIKYNEQRDLWSKIQNITGDKGEMTGYHLNKLEQRITQLYSSLWEAGKAQGCSGEDNVLVDISEKQAAELAKIYNDFEYGVKDTMEWLHLVRDTDCIAKKATTRNSVRLKGNFKTFSNLPISTKLRYIRKDLQVKSRRIRKYINSIKEHEMKCKRGLRENFDNSIAFQNWRNTLSNKVIVERAQTVYSALINECEERSAHIEAIQSSTSQSKNTQASKNFLSSLPENTVAAINAWLRESGCNQGFNVINSNESFAFLGKEDDCSKWAKKMVQLNKIIFRKNSSLEDMAHIRQELENTFKLLHELESKISTSQRKYRTETISYLLKTNKIENFTKKINPKSRDSPTTHTEIWDSKLHKFRTCRNETEELIATGEFHGRWMNNSAASEICAFAKVKKKGLLGARGVILSPDRKIGYSDIPKLIKNGDKLPLKIKRAFVSAHGAHTARLFRHPKIEHKTLYYPFYLQSYDGEAHGDQELAEMFWKSLTATPGKARYEGYHMSVVGRFGARWQKCLFDIIKLILLMRFIPRKLKKVARFPIPKPGRVNEYRPISLCHDVYCFINAVSTSYSSKGIQDANILHEGITAYVKGKGCSTLVGVEQSIREDCVESGVPMSQTDEDEEKFFDRIPVEVLLAAMRVNGFPEQGFLELKASGMEAKTVEIITGKGIAHARFICGLEQGNPDSPTISNLVIKFKHDIWRNLLNEIKTDKLSKECKTQIKNIYNKDAYRFQMVDSIDGPVIIDRIGYCDDNTRYTTSFNENEVITTTKHYIQQAGDLSMVTKIGRKGSKSEVHYFNLSAELALSIQEIETTAWSFAKDAPTTEFVPFKIALRQNELDKMFKITNFSELPKEEQDDLLRIFKAKPHKHLGLRSSISGNAREASLEVVKKIKARLGQLRIYSLDKEAQRISCNMLCTTMHSYAPLQMAHDPNHLMECDNLMISQIAKRHGYSVTDSKHALFIQEKNGGHGFKSFLDVDIASNVREIEIILNGWMLDSKATRSRLKSYSKYINLPCEDIQHSNHIGAAIRKIAKYGLHVRDKSDGIINYILGALSKRKSYASLGSNSYSDSNKYSMGTGKVQNLDLAYGSILHSYLRKSITQNGGWRDIESESDGQHKLPVAKSTLKRIFKKVRNQLFDDIVTPFNCWEWSMFKEDGTQRNDIENRQQWQFISITQILKAKFPNSYWNLSPTLLATEARNILNNRLANNKKLKDYIRISHGPPIFATDGSHYENSADKNKKRATTGAAVLCVLDIRSNEALEDAQWKDRKTIPVFARANKLPSQYGSQPSDISHGEGTGVCMGIEMMQEFKGGVLVMDSQAVRDITVSLRDRGMQAKIDRQYIKQTASGMSKHICSRIKKALETLHQSNALLRKCNRINMFIGICKKWGDESENAKWKEKYIRDHPYLPILKIDSHQLNQEGDRINARKRYDKLVPCLSLLNSNHHADRCAAFIGHMDFNMPLGTANSICLPDSDLRFSITWDGVGIDKHVSEFVMQKIQIERIKRLKSKPTQGLPWRIIENSSMTWKELNKFQRLRRSICGLSRTHTRSLYKSDLYRGGQIKEVSKRKTHSNSVLKIQTKQQWITFLSPCTWCENKDCVPGNRMHAMFFCDKEELSGFRLKMSQLLERKLAELIQYINLTMNGKEVENFLQKVESTMTELHGKEKMEREDAHMRYRSRATWLLEENMATWQEMVSSVIPIYSHIFGFTPVMEFEIKSGMEIDQALCIPLGFASRALDKVVDSLVSRYRVFSSDSIMCRTMEGNILSLWKEIKDINMARAMGLHSIIGDVSKNYEHKYRKGDKFGESTDVLPALGTCKKPIISALKKRSICTITGATEIRRRTKKVRFTKRNEETKLCQGITCAPMIGKSQFLMPTRNTIQYSKKHCQRCSRQITALRCGAEALINCNELKQTDIKEVIEVMDNKTSQRVDYGATMEILPALKSGSSKNSKQIYSDKQKNTIKTIQTCITRTTSRAQNEGKRINEAIKFMETTIKVSNKFLKDDSRHSMQIERALPEVKSYTQKQTRITNSQGKEQTIHETVWISSQEDKLIRFDRKETLHRGSYMSDRTMTRAINNIRVKFSNSNIYIATPMASSLLAHWNNSQGWEEFAKIFRSIKVIQEKPNGIYLIPIFSGEARDGHWSFAAIVKAYKDCRGWMVDSLGTGGTSSEIANKIQKAFSKNRLKCKWIPVRCQAQQEVECGPRTVWGMVSICEAIKEGALIEEAISQASLLNAANMYDPDKIRRKVATWIEERADVRIHMEAENALLRRYWSRRRRRGRHSQHSSSRREAVEVIEIE